MEGLSYDEFETLKIVFKIRLDEYYKAFNEVQNNDFKKHYLEQIYKFEGILKKLDKISIHDFQD